VSTGTTTSTTTTTTRVAVPLTAVHGPNKKGTPLLLLLLFFESLRFSSQCGLLSLPKGLPTLLHLVSISSTFYARVFHTKFWHQKWLSQMYLEKSCSICFCMKNARVKCWWNWLLNCNTIMFQKRERRVTSFRGLWLCSSRAFYIPGFNFINILRMNFSYKSALHSFSLVTFWLCNFLTQKHWCKVTHKMLMKLTPWKLSTLLFSHTNTTKTK